MERNSKSGVIGVIITIIILVLLVVFTNKNTENISTIENFANVVIVPIQNGLTYLKNKINNKNNIDNSGRAWYIIQAVAWAIQQKQITLKKVKKVVDKY